jgi:hypothetical protein
MIQVDGQSSILNTSSGLDGVSMQPASILTMLSLENDTVHTLSVGWKASEPLNSSNGAVNPASFAFFSHMEIGDFRRVCVIQFQ